MISLLLCGLLASLASALWPAPSFFEHGETVLWLSEHAPFELAGASNPHTLNAQDFYEFGPRPSCTAQKNDQRRRSTEKHDLKAPSGGEMIKHAVCSAKQTIFRENFVPWKFNQRNWTEPAKTNRTYISSVNLRVLKDDPDGIAKPLAGTIDESYRVEISRAGEASITANSSMGIVRGLTTFTQLFYQHSEGGDSYTPLAPINIFDAPKFAHRGINLDVSRNYFTTKDIERTIGALAYNKMNRFHLHVTDGQSWPLVIPTFPELSEKGAYRPNLVYTPQDFAELQYFAALRGVELITEIDMPGHTSAIALSHPDLIAAYDIQPDWDKYCAEPPCGTLKLNSTKVRSFLERLFDDLLPRVHPFSSYFHTGGDEVNKNAYLKDDTVRSNDPKVLQPLMQKFIDRNHDQIRAAGLVPIVWEEMLLEWNLTLGSDVVVQSWQSDEAVAQIVERGHKALVGNYKYWVCTHSHHCFSILLIACLNSISTAVKANGSILIHQWQGSTGLTKITALRSTIGAWPILTIR